MWPHLKNAFGRSPLRLQYINSTFFEVDVIVHVDGNTETEHVY